MSSGVLAQSIGGFSASAAASVVMAPSVAVGGYGGAGSLAGIVDVAVASLVQTNGAFSFGILAQSIGGNGGNGGWSQSNASSNKYAAAVAIGGSGAGGGSANTVDVSTGGSVYTYGDVSAGIFAQSVGGGVGMSTSTVTLGGSNISSNGGTVQVTVNGTVTTSGSESIGVLAQSVGGGSGSTGLVTVTVNSGGSVTATGTGSKAINASSTSDPTANVAAGASVVGGAGGVGVLMNSPTNVLNNSGQISTADGATGMAVQATAGDTTISNGGQLQSSMQLAAGGNNLLHNLVGGSVLAGPALDLGGTGVLQNDGTLASASTTLGSTQINGALIQSSTGVMQVRMDAQTGVTDSFVVSGASQLSGKLQPLSSNLGKIIAGIHIADLIVSGGGVSLSGLTLDALASAILRYSLSTVGNTVRLGSLVNFAPAGLSGNARAIAPIIVAVQGYGGSPLFSLLLPQLVAIPTMAGLDTAYQTISGNGASAAPQATSLMLDAVTNQMDAWRIGMLNNPGGGARAPLVAHQGDVGHANVWFAPIANGGTGQGARNRLYGGVMGVDETLNSTSIPMLVGGAVSGTDSFYSDASPSEHGRVSDVGLNLYGVGQLGRGYVSAMAFGGAGRAGLDRNL